jgi:hypothetical protein
MVAVAALALGLGVNLTIFGVYDALILKPLPVADPDRMVRLKRWFQHHQGNDQFRFAPAEYQYLREHSRTLVARCSGGPYRPITSQCSAKRRFWADSSDQRKTARLAPAR